MAQVKREMARPVPIRLQLNNSQRHRLDLAEAESGEDYDSRLDECATPMSVASAAQRDWNAAVSYADSDVLNREDLQSPGMVPPMSPGPQADKDVVLFEGAEGGESSPSRSLALTPSSRSGMSRRVSAPNPQAVRPLRIGRAMSLAATPGEPADQYDPALASMRTPPSVGRDEDPSAGTPASLADSNSPQEDSGGAAGSGGGGGRQFKTAYTFQRPNNGNSGPAINASAARAAAAIAAAGGGGGGELEEPIPLTPSSMAASRSLHDKKKHRPLLRVAVGKGRQRRHDQHARQELGEALAGEDYDSTLEDCGTPIGACDDYDPECGTPCSFAPDDMDTRSDC